MKDALGSVQSMLVLGGGSDIGLATCAALVRRRSARIVLAARKPEALDPAAAALRATGASSVDVVPFDATDFGSHESFVSSAFERFGDFDVVLLAFGVLGDQERAEVDTSAALEIVQTNYTAAARKATARSCCSRRSPVSECGARTSSTDRRRQVLTDTSKASATRYMEPEST